MEKKVCGIEKLLLHPMIKRHFVVEYERLELY